MILEKITILVKKNKMERTDVYKLIDGERDYQEWRWEAEIREDSTCSKSDGNSWLS